MRLADLFRDRFPAVADFLEKLRYVDDMAKSVSTKMEALRLIQDTEEVLESVKMKIKGWSVSGQDPPPELTEDGISVGLGVMKCLPRIDGFKKTYNPFILVKRKYEDFLMI